MSSKQIGDRGRQSAAQCSNPKPSAAGDDSIHAALLEYTKDRLSETGEQIKEFRTWARQLASAVVILFGLELTAVGKLWFDWVGQFDILCSIGSIAFVAALIVQLCALSIALLSGFSGDTLEGPPSPRAVHDAISQTGSSNAIEVITNSYINAYPSLLELQERLARRLRRSSTILVLSLLLVGIGVAVLGFGVVEQRDHLMAAASSQSKHQQNLTTHRKP